MEQLGRDGRITSKNAPPTVVTTGAAAGGTGVIIASACRFVVFGVAERATSTIAAAAAASGGSGIFSPLIFQPHNTLAGQGLDQQTPCQSTVLLSLQQEIYSSVRVGFAGQEESEDPQFPEGRQTALKLPLALANTTKSSTRVNLLS